MAATAAGTLRQVPRPAVAAVTAAAVLGVAACSGGDDGSIEAFCETARRFAEDNPAVVFDRYDPADPTGAAEDLRGAAQQLRAWADDAPGEVDDDIGAIAGAAETLADAFESPPPSGDRVAELESQFNEVELASARVTSFTREQCGVDLDPAGGPVSPSTTTSTPP